MRMPAVSNPPPDRRAQPVFRIVSGVSDRSRIQNAICEPRESEFLSARVIANTAPYQVSTVSRQQYKSHKRVSCTPSHHLRAGKLSPSFFR